jgi:hypothetical protein
MHARKEIKVLKLLPYSRHCAKEQPHLFPPFYSHKNNEIFFPFYFYLTDEEHRFFGINSEQKLLQ